MFSRSPSSPTRPASSVSLSSGKQWKPNLGSNKSINSANVRSQIGGSLSSYGSGTSSRVPVPVRSSGSGSNKRMGTAYPQDGVVIRAGFSILPPGISKTKFKTKYEPTPAHKDPQTESARLTVQIQDFLKRSDHIEQQWSKMTGRKHYPKSRDNIKTSIAIRGFQMSHSSSLATMEDMDSSYVLQHSETMSLLDVPNPFDEADELEADLLKDPNNKDAADWDCSELDSLVSESKGEESINVKKRDDDNKLALAKVADITT